MRAFVLILLGSVALGSAALSCRSDTACKAVLQYAPDVKARLDIPEVASATDDAIGPTRSLSPATASHLMREAQLLATQLPASSPDEDLNVLLRKLGSRRAALQQALQDFLAIDPQRLEQGLDSGATMPVRRSVVMSRDGVVSLAATARELCEGRQ